MPKGRTTIFELIIINNYSSKFKWENDGVVEHIGYKLLFFFAINLST